MCTCVYARVCICEQKERPNRVSERRDGDGIEDDENKKKIKEKRRQSNRERERERASERRRRSEGYVRVEKKREAYVFCIQLRPVRRAVETRGRIVSAAILLSRPRFSAMFFRHAAPRCHEDNNTFTRRIFAGKEGGDDRSSLRVKLF